MVDEKVICETIEIICKCFMNTEVVFLNRAIYK